MPRSYHWRLSTNCQLYTTDRHFWLCCVGQAHRSPLIGKKYGHLANPHSKVTRMRDLESFKHYSSMILAIISQNQLPKPTRPHFEGALRSSSLESVIHISLNGCHQAGSSKGNTSTLTIQSTIIADLQPWSTWRTCHRPK